MICGCMRDWGDLCGPFSPQGQMVFQPGLVQQIEAQPGPQRDPGRAETWPGDTDAHTVTGSGVSAWWLPGVLNFLRLKPTTRWVSSYPSSGGARAPQRGWHLASVGVVHVCGMTGRQASSGGFRRLEVEELAVRAGRGAGPRQPPAPDWSFGLCRSSCLCCTWRGGLEQQTREGPYLSAPASLRPSHTLLRGVCFYVLRFITLTKQLTIFGDKRQGQLGQRGIS